MFTGSNLPTHSQISAQLDAKYQLAIDQGVFKPYVYPLGAFGVILVVIYFLIPHHNRPDIARLRFTIWFANLLLSLYIILNFRARRAPIDYGVGLITWWFVLWTTAVMVAQDGQVEYWRIERVEGATGTVSVQRAGVVAQANGHGKGVKEAKAKPVKRLRWQSYPTDSFIERVDWVFDLLSNFRGMSWNWRIPMLPAPPKEVQLQIANSNDDDDNALKESWRSKPPPQPLSREAVLRNARRKFVIGYLCLDFIKTLILHDPYFRGLGAAHKPSYLPAMILAFPVLLRALRLLIGLFAIYWALATIFTLAPLFFVGVLGETLIGVRGSPWMYPQEFGSFRTVLDRGLAGWWGAWWHQTFRFAFEAPSKRLVALLGVERRSLLGRTLQLFVAFALSGTLHASGSHTSIGETRPTRGPFMFFVLQPFGIIGQMIVARALQRMEVTKSLPMVVRQATNFVVVHTWFYFTARLLIDDLAAGGTFLYEPVPFSIFRFLGMGGKGVSGVCWQWPWNWFYWHTSDRWWETGLST